MLDNKFFRTSRSQVRLGQGLSIIQGLGMSTLQKHLSIKFSHPECLHYSGTRSVCFIIVNFVYPFQSPRMSPLFRDTECLLSNWKMCLSISVTRSVSIILGLRVSTLVWDKDCLLCSGTQSPKEDRVSFLLCHEECLPCYGICLHYYCMVSLLVCLSDLSTLFSLLSSLLLAPV